jgi:hypothetical protein
VKDSTTRPVIAGLADQRRRGFSQVDSVRAVHDLTGAAETDGPGPPVSGSTPS